jgi:uncharacterized protein (TIGR03579 family)
MRDRLKDFLMRPLAFPLLVGLASAAIFAGTHMYVVHGTGAFNDIFVVQMLDQGLSTGDFAAASGFAAGFLLARILEGPLVGILDIGGSLQTGVGIGIPALMLASGLTAPIHNFPLALLTGLIIGIAIGALIIGIRKFMPQGVIASGSDIMMGAGNSAGRFLGPLILIAAIQFSIPAGVGAFIGAALFYFWKKPITGGAILGAMILGSFFV